jgi:AraC-like DNA-binding protein/mannose-6-phosphate isomerase-like protein (cupin superfamily)
LHLSPTLKNGRVTNGANEFLPKAITAEAIGQAVAIVETRQTAGKTEQPKDGYSRFFLVLSGSMYWECDERRLLLGPNTLCHVPAGLTFRQEIMANQEVLAYVLRYPSEMILPELGQRLAGSGMIRIDLSATTADQSRPVISIFREMLFEQDSRQDGWEMVLESRLIDLAVRLLRLTNRKGSDVTTPFDPGSDSGDRIARYVLRLKTQFFRQETMRDAARATGLSCRQFSELFRKATGQSWRQHVLGLRLKHATTLLAETDKSVSDVVFESGFDDLSNFHHVFKVTHGCSPLAYRERHRVKLPTKAQFFADNQPTSSGFRFRGMKGWSWTPEQYLEEIPAVASLKMNFLMNCYRSMSVSRPGEPWVNEWWRPLTDERKKKFSEIIRKCEQHHIAFCFAMHPQLASPRPLEHGNQNDFEAFFQHYAWAQSQGVKWFAVCLDDTSWGKDGPSVCASKHSALVNQVMERLQAKDGEANMIFCPAAFWGDGTNPEHAAYLAVVARALHPDVFVFWTGDAIVTPRITHVAAQSYRMAVRHRLFLWDNYPENADSPTMHLGPLSGREPDLCGVVDGYLSNSMCRQNQINRIPLATCADYANDPQNYKPARSIGQAIVRFADSKPQQSVLKELVEAYPGFIVAGGGAGTNPVRAKLGGLLAHDRTRTLARKFIATMEDLAARMRKSFPAQFLDARKTLSDDISWMKAQVDTRKPQDAVK